MNRKRHNEAVAQRIITDHPGLAELLRHMFTQLHPGHRVVAVVAVTTDPTIHKGDAAEEVRLAIAADTVHSTLPVIAAGLVDGAELMIENDANRPTT